MDITNLLTNVPIPAELWAASAGIILLVAMAERAGLPNRFAGLAAFFIGVVVAAIYLWSVVGLPPRSVVGLSILYGLLAPLLHQHVVNPGKALLGFADVPQPRPPA